MRVPTYPASPEGLKSFIQDLLIAIRAKKDRKVAAFLHELIIPDHAAWFANVFGPEEGKKLSGQYERGLSDFKRNTRGYFEYVEPPFVLAAELFPLFRSKDVCEPSRM